MRQSSQCLFLCLLALAAALPIAGHSTEFEAQAVTAEYIGSALWTGGLDVWSEGSYAYCGFQNGLVILDISNPSAPTYVSSLYLQGGARGLAKSGNNVYIGGGQFGMYVVDVTDPADPIIIKRFDPLNSASVVSISIQDTLAFVADEGFGMRVVNIATPNSPVEVGSFVDPNKTGARDIALRGSLAYVVFAQSGFSAGLSILNIADPSAPSLLGYASISWGSHVALGDTVAVVVGSFGLDVVGIGNPNTPTVLGSDNRGNNGVAISGSTVFASDNTDGMSILDLTDPTLPDSIGRLVVRGRPRGISLLGSRAYVAHSQGMDIVWVSNPSAPVAEGSYQTSGSVNGFAIRDSLALVATKRGLRILNVKDPSLPTVIGTYPAPGRVTDLVVKGNLAYLIDTLGLIIVNTADPANPDSLGSLTISGLRYPSVSGNIVYVGRDTDVVMINVSDPSAPDSAGIWTTSSNIYETYTAGNMLYVGSSSGLHLLDITNPVVPAQVGFRDISAEAYDVALVDSFAFVANGDGVLVLNVADPASIDSVGMLYFGNSVYGITVADTLLYMANGSDGFALASVKDPLNPYLIGSYNTPGDALKVFARDSIVYLSDQTSFLMLETPFSLPVSVEEGKRLIPQRLELSQNYPNPFNPSTKIDYSVPGASHVSVEIIDVSGRTVTTLVDRFQSVGKYTVSWDGRNSGGKLVATGVYFYRLRIGESVITKKMVLLK